MGADAFWFCDNCKVKFQPEFAQGRNYLSVDAMFSKPPITWQEVSTWIETTRTLVRKDCIADEILHYLGWFEELRDFLKRHEGHEVLLTSDFSGSLEAGEYRDGNGIVWDRSFDYVGECEPTPENPRSNRTLG